MFIGPCVATFDHVETQAGLAVYVFRFSATGLDETAGYSYLPDVPERYAARRSGQGMLWVEPVSGIVVNYAEQGLSYFADPTTGKQVAEFHRWHNYYTPEIQTAQLRLASEARLRILLFRSGCRADWRLLVWFGAGPDGRGLFRGGVNRRRFGPTIYLGRMLRLRIRARAVAGRRRKLTLIFVLLARCFGLGLSIPAPYNNGPRAAGTTTISELLTTALEKQSHG